MPENVSNRNPSIPDAVLRAMTNPTDVPQKVESKYPTDTIPLPTKGWFYPDGHPLSNGEIELKQMTAKEEDLLSNQDLIRKGKILDKLLESLVVNKAIKINDILVPDKNAIFISIRRLAYGDDYPVSITCPACSASNKVTINLGSIENKPFEFDQYPRGENSFLFKLPKSGITLTYKLLSQIDEDSIEAEIKQLVKMNKESSKHLTTRLKYMITSVDGNGDKMVIRKFVDEGLVAKDSLELRKHIRNNTPDIDMSFDFICDSCSHERRLDIPIGVSFLWPLLES
jgi:hypothetical protein